ncbi:MAG: cobalamin biosynthesis protein [Methanophagales archaeon]|nr:cobalamin biosynthesis protein [Methanophagales archaeon]
MKRDKDVYIGIGFHRGVEAEEMERAIRIFLEEEGIELEEVKGLCTVEFRRTEELQEVSAKLGIPLLCFSRAEINRVEVQSRSAASSVFGIKGVAEPCAILGAMRNKGGFKFIKRESFDKRITLAVVF